MTVDFLMDERGRVSAGKIKPQVPPLRFAPVDDNSVVTQELPREILDPAIELSSRPERARISYFARPATTTYAVFFKKTA